MRLTSSYLGEKTGEPLHYSAALRGSLIDYIFIVVLDNKALENPTVR